MNGIQAIITNAEVGTSVSVDGLTAFPVYARTQPPVAYVTLDEALPGGRFEVREIAGAAQVPGLKVVNRGDTAVLIVHGELLRGGMQDRLVDKTILVPANTELEIPVSCVEAGRWRHESTLFLCSETLSSGTLRRLKMLQRLRRSPRAATPHSDQHEVWDEVHRKLQVHGSHSPSGTFYQVAADFQTRLSKIAAGLRLPVDCNGVVFAIGGVIAGADLFDSAATLGRVLPRLARSFALDALEARPAGAIGAATVKTWIAQAGQATCETHKAPGLGDEVRLNSAELRGAALVVDGQPVHVALYPGPGAPVQPAGAGGGAE